MSKSSHINNRGSLNRLNNSNSLKSRVDFFKREHRQKPPKELSLLLEPTVDVAFDVKISPKTDCSI